MVCVGVCLCRCVWACLGPASWSTPTTVAPSTVLGRAAVVEQLVDSGNVSDGDQVKVQSDETGRGH